MEALTVELKRMESQDWTEKEKQNVALVTDFVEHLMNKHDFDYVDRHFNNQSYLQHNRNMTDGINGVLTTVQDSHQAVSRLHL